MHRSKKALLRVLALKLRDMWHERDHVDSDLVHGWLKWVAHVSHIIHHGVVMLQSILFLLQLAFLHLKVPFVSLNVAKLIIQPADPLVKTIFFLFCIRQLFGQMVQLALHASKFHGKAQNKATENNYDESRWLSEESKGALHGSFPILLLG